MTENNQNNKEEKDNHFEENKNDDSLQNKKRLFVLTPKRKNLLLFVVVLVVVLIVGINFKDKKKYENAAIAQTKTENFEQIKDMENKSNMTKKEENNSIKINVNNMKISTPEQCKEKGLHYIGKMNVPRVFHQSIKLNDGNILIVGGYSKLESKKITFDGDYGEPIEYISEYSAEIFNPTNNNFFKVKSIPIEEDKLQLLKLDNGNILLISDKYYQIFDINKNIFNLPIEKTIYKKYRGTEDILYSEIIRDKILIECYGIISGSCINSCWLTNIDNFELESIQDIKLEIPAYMTPTYFGFLKLNKKEILIYTKSFPRTDVQNMYIAIYDIEKKTITKSIEVKGVGNYQISKPILLVNNRILFTGGIEYEKGGYTYYNKIFPWFIYDSNLNEIEKTINMIFPDSITSQEPINTENENLLIVENNKIRQFYNVQTNNLEKYNGFELENIVNPNIIQINNHQILITGGRYTKNGRNEFISSDAFIYTF